jgi:hypothetical protein
MKLTRCVLISITVFASINLFGQTAGGIRFALWPAAKQLAKPILMAYANHQLIVSEEDSGRTFIYDEFSGKQRKEFGGLGSEQGKTFHPAAMVVRGGQIIFLDALNYRVEAFSLDGQFTQESPIPSDSSSRTFAVDSHGNFYLNDPSRGSLVQMYDKNGAAIRSFGKLANLSELMRNGNTKIDEAYRDTANQAVFAMDDQDNLYVGYIIAPVIRKYAPDGSLVFQRDLPEQVFQTLTSLFVSYDKRNGGLSSTFGGPQVPYIIKSIALSPLQDKLYVLAANDLFHKNSLAEFRTSGQQLDWFVFDDGLPGSLFNICVGDHDLYGTTLFSHGLYVTPIPPDTGE